MNRIHQEINQRRILFVALNQVISMDTAQGLMQIYALLFNSLLMEYSFMYDMEITFQSLNQTSNYLLNVLTVRCGHKIIIQMYPFTSFHLIELFHEHHFYPIKLRHKCVFIM